MFSLQGMTLARHASGNIRGQRHSLTNFPGHRGQNGCSRFSNELCCQNSVDPWINKPCGFIWGSGCSPKNEEFPPKWNTHLLINQVFHRFPVSRKLVPTHFGAAFHWSYGMVMRGSFSKPDLSSIWERHRGLAKFQQQRPGQANSPSFPGPLRHFLGLCLFFWVSGWFEREIKCRRDEAG